MPLGSTTFTIWDSFNMLYLIMILFVCETSLGSSPPAESSEAETGGCGIANSSVTKQHQTQIVGYLNDKRRKSQMLSWDSSLASLAQLRAEICPTGKQTQQIFNCLDSELVELVDEIGQFIPDSHLHTPHLSQFTKFLSKSAKYEDFPTNYNRWYTCNPKIIVTLGSASRVGCGISTCEYYGSISGTTLVCYFTSKVDERVCKSQLGYL